MPFQQITSAENKTLKAIAKLKIKKYREQSREFVVEGLVSCRMALDSGFSVSRFVMTQDFLDSGAAISDILDHYPCILTTEKLFHPLSDTETPQGILAVVKMPAVNIELAGTKYLCCDNVRDPGNVGTIIRTADAMGFDGVLLTEGSVDLYNPKVVRATMGSIFHIPVLEHCGDGLLQNMKSAGFRLIASALTENSVSLYGLDCSGKLLFIVGNEANGIRPCLLDMADTTVKIPMFGKAESFNVSVAAALLMSEAVRGGRCNG